MGCKRGQLVLVPFPFTDLSAEKRRPVLCLTDPDSFGDFLAVAVTSKPHHAGAVAIDPKVLLEGQLPVASWVRVDRLVTLNQRLAIRAFGVADDAFVHSVITRVCEHVGLLTVPTSGGGGSR
jgi:mRNA interferase MazF